MIQGFNDELTIQLAGNTGIKRLVAPNCCPIQEVSEKKGYLTWQPFDESLITDAGSRVAKNQKLSSSSVRDQVLTYTTEDYGRGAELEGFEIQDFIRRGKDYKAEAKRRLDNEFMRVQMLWEKSFHDAITTWYGASPDALQTVTAAAGVGTKWTRSSSSAAQILTDVSTAVANFRTLHGSGGIGEFIIFGHEDGVRIVQDALAIIGSEAAWDRYIESDFITSDLIDFRKGGVRFLGVNAQYKSVDDLTFSQIWSTKHVYLLKPVSPVVQNGQTKNFAYTACWLRTADGMARVEGGLPILATQDDEPKHPQMSWYSQFITNFGVNVMDGYRIVRITGSGAGDLW